MVTLIPHHYHPPHHPPKVKREMYLIGRFRRKVWACMAWGLLFHNLVPENCTHYWAPLATKINSMLVMGGRTCVVLKLSIQKHTVATYPNKRSRALLEVKLTFWWQHLSFLPCSGGSESCQGTLVLFTGLSPNCTMNQKVFLHNTGFAIRAQIYIWVQSFHSMFNMELC